MHKEGDLVKSKYDNGEYIYDWEVQNHEYKVLKHNIRELISICDCDDKISLYENYLFEIRRAMRKKDSDLLFHLRMILREQGLWNINETIED
ncbi:hypothetical protein CO725_13690 [Vibrio parahaemolyticus]|uniref:hypothetical protein n=1 Tax=Vibrio parahaemolyticus TaxID=670 RepID=UPI000BE441DF|nr:hypothetical protein [Vibrio parahaemolyticus]ATI46684.1 hypothetical protein CO725_13690 [Vibrio parahaemolyticus]